jgi:Caspase domain
MSRAVLALVAGLVAVAAVAAAQPATWLSETTSPLFINQALGPTKVYGKSYALVISESHYQDGGGWEDLPFNSAEADNLAGVLVAQGFAVQRVKDPTAAELQSILRAFVTRFGSPDARFVVFYTGHGWSDLNALEGYLVPADAPNPNTSRAAFNQKAISTAEILGVSRQANARHVLFVFDSCFSAAVFKTKGGAPTLPSALYVESLKGPARQFLTATAEDEKAPSHSVFTPAFAEGIRGGADYNRDGVVTGLELALWLKTTVASSDTPTKPQYGDVQSRGGDIVFSPPPADNPTTGAAHQFRPAAQLAPPTKPAEFDGLQIFYYRKAADRLNIIHALETQHVPAEITRSSNPESLTTNTLACSANADARAVRATKTIALALIDNGIPLYEVQQFNKPGKGATRIELLNSARYGWNGKRPLTRDQVEGLSSCPASLHN